MGIFHKIKHTSARSSVFSSNKRAMKIFQEISKSQGTFLDSNCVCLEKTVDGFLFAVDKTKIKSKG